MFRTILWPRIYLSVKPTARFYETLPRGLFGMGCHCTSDAVNMNSIIKMEKDTTLNLLYALMIMN